MCNIPLLEIPTRKFLLAREVCKQTVSGALHTRPRVREGAGSENVEQEGFLGCAFPAIGWDAAVTVLEDASLNSYVNAIQQSGSRVYTTLHSRPSARYYCLAPHDHRTLRLRSLLNLRCSTRALNLQTATRHSVWRGVRDQAAVTACPRLMLGFHHVSTHSLI